MNNALLIIQVVVSTVPKAELSNKKGKELSSYTAHRPGIPLLNIVVEYLAPYVLAAAKTYQGKGHSTLRLSKFSSFVSGQSLNASV